MAREVFSAATFHGRNRIAIERAERILEAYAANGHRITLRQLYYQFVARGWIANSKQSYNQLSVLLSRARLSGRIDWDHIIDRTRTFRTNAHWTDAKACLLDAARYFDMDVWATQPFRPEVWIEKDALAGIIEGPCREWDVGFFSCRGYSSQSEMYLASRRLMSYYERGQTPVILHFGDHDPSGLHMTQDITERMAMFFHNSDFDPPEIRRCALTPEQIRQYKLPPNPTKVADSRAKGYMRHHGSKSWELDALPPQALVDLVNTHVFTLRIDRDAWDTAVATVEDERTKLTQLAEHWSRVHTFLKRPPRRRKEPPHE